MPPVLESEAELVSHQFTWLGTFDGNRVAAAVVNVAPGAVVSTAMRDGSHRNLEVEPLEQIRHQRGYLGALRTLQRHVRE